MARMMKAAVFVEPGRITLDKKPAPDIGPNDALLGIIRTATRCADIDILKGEQPVEKDLIIESGHLDLGGLIAQRMGLDEMGDAHILFADQRNCVLKTVITP